MFAAISRSNSWSDSVKARRPQIDKGTRAALEFLHQPAEQSLLLFQVRALNRLPTALLGPIRGCRWIGTGSAGIRPNRWLRNETAKSGTKHQKADANGKEGTKSHDGMLGKKDAVSNEFLRTLASFSLAE